jgi:hypothetical protein
MDMPVQPFLRTRNGWDDARDVTKVPAMEAVLARCCPRRLFLVRGVNDKHQGAVPEARTAVARCADEGAVDSCWPSRSMASFILILQSVAMPSEVRGVW